MLGAVWCHEARSLTHKVLLSPYPKQALPYMGAEPKYRDSCSRGKCHQRGGNFFAVWRVNGDCAGRESRARCFRVAMLDPVVAVIP